MLLAPVALRCDLEPVEGHLPAVFVQDHHVVAAVLHVGREDELHRVRGGGEDPADPVGHFVEVDVVPLAVGETLQGDLLAVAVFVRSAQVKGGRLAFEVLERQYRLTLRLRGLDRVYRD